FRSASASAPRQPPNSRRKAKLSGVPAEPETRYPVPAPNATAFACHASTDGGSEKRQACLLSAARREGSARAEGRAAGGAGRERRQGWRHQGGRGRLRSQLPAAAEARGDSGSRRGGRGQASARGGRQA